MKTKVILDGILGKKFGKKWELFVDSPAHALKLINANRPEFVYWIRDNAEIYEGYKVTCEYHNGVTEVISEKELMIDGKIKSIRFTPVLTGSGGNNGLMSVIIGAVMIIAAVATMGAGLMAEMAAFAAISEATMTSIVVGVGMMGASLMLGGISSLISPQPATNAAGVNATSRYFNGAVNTSVQGTPVQLVYGRCLVGSHVISASLTVNESVIK